MDLVVVGSGAVGPLPALAVVSQALAIVDRYDDAPVTGVAHWVSTLVASRSVSRAEPRSARTSSAASSATWIAPLRPLCWLVTDSDVTRNADIEAMMMPTIAIATMVSIRLKPAS